MRVGRTVTSGALAGLVGGLLLGILLFFLAEPIIDAAICYEQGTLPGCLQEAGPVPRDQQRVALLWANPVVGLVVGSLFALVYGAVYPYLPGKSARVKSLILAVMGFYILPFLPNVALPPLPPGLSIGGQEPDASAGARLLWYAILFATAVVALLVGFAVYHLLVRRNPSRRTHMVAGPLSLALIAGISAIPLAFFPFGAFRPGGAAGLLALLPSYTAISVGSWLAYWVVLALVFGHLWTRAEARAVKSGAPEPA